MDPQQRTIVVCEQRSFSRDLGIAAAGGGVALFLAGMTVLGYRIFKPPKVQPFTMTKEFTDNFKELVKLGIVEALPDIQHAVEAGCTKVLSETFQITVTDDEAEAGKETKGVLEKRP